MEAVVAGPGRVEPGAPAPADVPAAGAWELVAVARHRTSCAVARGVVARADAGAAGAGCAVALAYGGAGARDGPCGGSASPSACCPTADSPTHPAHLLVPPQPLAAYKKRTPPASGGHWAAHYRPCCALHLGCPAGTRRCRPSAVVAHHSRPRFVCPFGRRVETADRAYPGVADRQPEGLRNDVVGYPVAIPRH